MSLESVLRPQRNREVLVAHLRQKTRGMSEEEARDVLDQLVIGPPTDVKHVIHASASSVPEHSNWREHEEKVIMAV